MSGVSDWELVARAQAGDMHAFAELVRRYQAPVIHFCHRMVGSLQDAEDIAQDSFVRVFRYLPRLRPDAKFSTVVFGMARNLALNFIRDSKRRGRGLTQPLTGENVAGCLVDYEPQRPDRLARLREIESLIEQGIARLSPEHREILILRELQGLDYDAIARVVRCRKGTVKSRLARAREQLRLRLAELGSEWL